MALIEINWRPDRKQLRQFGYVSAVVFACLGAWAAFRQSLFGFQLGDAADPVARGMWGLAGTCLLLAMIAPTWLRPLYIALTAASLPIGWAVSHALLAVVYYGLLTPLGLFFRLIGRDPLNRRLDPTAATYWETRRSVIDPKRYLRQF